MGNSNSQGKHKQEQLAEKGDENSQICCDGKDGDVNSIHNDCDADANGDIIVNKSGYQEIQTGEDARDDANPIIEDKVDSGTDKQYTSGPVEVKATLLDLATVPKSRTSSVISSSVISTSSDDVASVPDPAPSEPPIDNPLSDIDAELTGAEALKEKTGYVDLQEVSRGEPTPEPEVDQDNCSEEDGVELSEDKKFDTVMRIVIHTINNIERSTDIGSEIDPFVEVRANQVLLGATKPKTNMTTASVEESFYIKTERNPKCIKLKFHLKDKDHMSDDDLLGHGYFDLAEEDNTMNQIVHLKWRGEEIGTILISVDFQNLVVM
ncbi:uncharacterized protein LOC134814203 [Bolinopsis microptera]|uniref:uncharacterized protein LOC134814203 n=1 Tax=Bolinopsis microptera TaxID=2820187 RepID=UPI00307AB3DC